MDGPVSPINFIQIASKLVRVVLDFATFLPGSVPKESSIMKLVTLP